MSMADRDGWIWYDGKVVPWRDATTHVLTHTLHYGMASSKAYAATRPPTAQRSSGYTTTPTDCSAPRRSSR